MQLRQARVIVAGATGVLGGKLARQLHGEGAILGLAGRDAQRLDELADQLDGVPTRTCDALDPESCSAAVDELASAMGGLDAVLVAFGVAAFGPAEDATDETTKLLFTVNTHGPMAIIRAALDRFVERGTVAAVSAILTDYPTAEMAEYSASKAALSAWLSALRHEQRRHGVTVFDIRPPHMDTGLADRPIAGRAAPSLPQPWAGDAVAEEIIAGLREDSRELALDIGTKELRRR